MQSTAIISIIVLTLSFINHGESKAILQDGGNPTMYFYVFPMKVEEAEAIQRQARQEDEGTEAPEATEVPEATLNNNNNGNRTGSEDTATGLPLVDTAINLANVFNGLFRQDVRPILSGSTALVPPGDLRDGVTNILNGIAPALQNLLFNNRLFGNRRPANNNMAPTLQRFVYTSPRPRHPESPALELTIAPALTSSSSIQSVAAETIAHATSTSEPFPQDREPVIDNFNALFPESPVEEKPEEEIAPQQQPENVYEPIPQVGTGEPEVISAIPEVSAGESEVIHAIPEVTTGGPTPTSVVNQLKVVLEDAHSIVTANAVSNAVGKDKQYVYLVVLPEQLNQFTVPNVNLDNPQPYVTDLKPEVPLRHQQQEGGDQYRISKNRTTTIPPPHLQLQYHYKLTNKGSTAATTSTERSAGSTDLPGVKGFEDEDDELARSAPEKLSANY